jgi:hypothetical protein
MAYRLGRRLYGGGQQVLHGDHLLLSSTRIVAMVAIFVSSPASAERMLVAQAGSVGGSIGKTDKSLSSDDQDQQSSTHHTKSGVQANRILDRAEPLPKTIQLNDRFSGLSYSVTLRNVGGHNYEGTWSHGYVTKFEVTVFTRDTLTMKRNDNPAFGAVTGSYSGPRTGNHATGEATVSNGATTKWDASW